MMIKISLKNLVKLYVKNKKAQKKLRWRERQHRQEVLALEGKISALESKVEGLEDETSDLHNEVDHLQQTLIRYDPNQEAAFRYHYRKEDSLSKSKSTSYSTEEDSTNSTDESTTKSSSTH